MFKEGEIVWYQLENSSRYRKCMVMTQTQSMTEVSMIHFYKDNNWDYQYKKLKTNLLIRDADLSIKPGDIATIKNNGDPLKPIDSISGVLEPTEIPGVDYYISVLGFKNNKQLSGTITRSMILQLTKSVDDIDDWKLKIAVQRYNASKRNRNTKIPNSAQIKKERSTDELPKIQPNKITKAIIRLSNKIKKKKNHKIAQVSKPNIEQSNDNTNNSDSTLTKSLTCSPKTAKEIRKMTLKPNMRVLFKYSEEVTDYITILYYSSYKKKWRYIFDDNGIYAQNSLKGWL